ncbi:MAG TPA: TIGR03936 family radical SAM-associated protein [Ilumatobacteraceae bacterium]|nr:TIGR03936 family radical SAM-associated protein [Ilumatobacteraceae bacterium]
MKLRIRSTKLGKIRFVSHRDGARLWERALRKVGLPTAHSAGYTPRPKISFGLALPTGAESIAEYVDVELRDGVSPDLDALHEELSEALPDGIDVTVVAERQHADESLQEIVTSCTWELWSDLLAPADIEKATGLLDAGRLMIERERKGHRHLDDIRPAVLDLHPDATGQRLVAELATIGRALRPSELASLAFADVDPLDVRALRTHQWISHDGDRREVLSLPAAMAAPTREVGA